MGSGILSENQRLMYAEAFVKLDKDADGSLSMEEMVKWLRETHPNLSDQLVKVIFNLIDTNADGKITLDEFFTGIELVHEPLSRQSRAYQKIQSVDTNKTGFLSEDKLVLELTNCGYTVTKMQIRKFVPDPSKTEDGRINLEELFNAFDC